MSRATVDVADGTEIWLESLPSGKVMDVKVVRIDSTFAFMDAKGQVYCPRVRSGTHYGLQHHHYTEPMFRCLVKLGALPKEQVEAHFAECKRREAERDAEYDMDRLKELADKYKFVVTKAQESKIRRGKK